MTSARGFQLLRSSMTGMELVAADSAHAFGRHTHDQFGIGRVERGAQRSASGRGVVEAGAGDIITVNPGEVHDGKPLDSTGRRWRMLYVEPTRLLDAADDIRPGAGFEFTAPVIRDGVLSARLTALFDAAMGDEPLQSEAALLSLMARLLRPAPRGRPGLAAGIAAARERMDDDPGASPTLATLAEGAGLSRYQFLRAFTQLTGLPPHAYLLQRRAQHARRLVGQGVTLADAAAASGFADQSHMTRTLVRMFGMTPGAFAPRAASSRSPRR